MEETRSVGDDKAGDRGNMDPRSARPGLGSQLAEVFDGPPDISDIRGRALQPMDKRVDILACPKKVHELTVRRQQAV